MFCESIRRQVSALLILSILSSSLTPAFATLNNDDDNDSYDEQAVKQPKQTVELRSTILDHKNESPDLKTPLIPCNYKEWDYVRHINGSGGGTGVHVLFDKKTNKKFTLKEATHQNHLIEELTAKKLYQVLGFNAPKFVILDRTSNLWPNTWNEKFPTAPRLMISQFIEEDPKATHQDREKISRWVDVLLGNFDLARHNYVIDDQGEEWPIDFGGSLRLRANGEIKEHTGLWGYFWPQETEVAPPTEAELSKFKTNIPALFETLLDLHRELYIPDFQYLWNIMASRVHSFLSTYDGKSAVQFLGDRPALENLVGGGVLLLTHVAGVPHVLLAKRHDGTWSDLGGGAKSNDKTLNRTAWRESIEEMGSFIPLDFSKLTQSPYIEHNGDILYRMFIHPVDPFDVESLKAHVLSKKNPYAVEHEEFSLVPLDSLDQNKGLYGPMRDLLSTPHAKAILKGVAQGNKLIPAKGGSPIQGSMRLGNYKFNTLKTDLLPSNTLNAKIDAAIELKTKINKPKSLSNALSRRDVNTQTRGMLKAHLKEAYVAGDDAQNLTTLLLKKSSFFAGKPQVLAKKLPYIQQIMSTEETHPDHCVFYHGGLGHYGLLWLIASDLRNDLFLNGENSVKTLRLYENAFSGTPTLDKHFELIEEAKEEQSMDYSKGGQARILSTNLSLVGSIGRSSSETLEYFFNNACMDTPEQPIEILRKYLELTLKLPKMAVDQFINEMMPYFSDLDKVGTLYQVFLPPALAERYTYLSLPGGSRALFKGQEKDAKTINSPINYVQMLRSFPENVETSVQGDFNLFQGRVMLHPEMLYGEQNDQIHPYVYFSDGRSVTDLQSKVKQLVRRVLKPHLSLASSNLSYETPPPLMKLNQLITGSTVNTIIDPRLEELVELAKSDAPNQDEIMRRLEDLEVAKLERVDPLSLQRVRATAQSTLLATVADYLAPRLQTLDQVSWVKELGLLKDKYARIVEFLKAQNLYVDTQKVEDLANLLAVEPKDKEFNRLQHLLECPHTRDLLTKSTPQIKNFMGRVVVELHRWGKKRGPILRRMIDVGMIKLESDALNFITILEIANLKTDPDQLRDVLNMLLEEKFLLKNSCIGNAEFIAKIISMGIEKSRLKLRKTFVDLDINKKAIDFSDALTLLHIAQEHENWEELVSNYNRLLKKRVNISDVPSALQLLLTNETAVVESTLDTMNAEGFFDSRDVDAAKSLGLPGFLDSLLKSPHPTGVLHNLKSLSLNNHFFFTLAEIIADVSTFDRFAKFAVAKGYKTNAADYEHIMRSLNTMPSSKQERFLNIFLSPSVTLQMMTNFAKIIGILNIHKDRLDDFEVLIPHIIRGYNPLSLFLDGQLRWALSQDSSLLSSTCLFLELGLGINVDQQGYVSTPDGPFPESNAHLFPLVVQNYDYIKENFEILKPFTNSVEAIRRNGEHVFKKIGENKPSPKDLKQLVESAMKTRAYFLGELHIVGLH